MNKSTMAALLMLSLGWVSASAQQAPQHHHDHSHHVTMEAASVNQSDSIYHLDGLWQTHRGEIIELSQLQGSPVVISMIYGNCATACPVLVNDARRIYSALPPEYQQHVKLVMVSFDDDRDTPAALADYVERYQLNESAWTFLHGNDTDIRTLATVLGIRYRLRDDGNFDHSNLITVLDKHGRIVERIEGLNRPVEPTVAVLKKMIDAGHAHAH